MDTVIMADPVSCLSTNLFPPPFLLIESWILQESNEPSWAMYPNCSKPVFNNPVPIWQKLNSHTSLQLNTATWSIWVSLRLLDFFLFFFFFIYLWLCWVFISVWGLSLVAESGGHSSSRCAGLSLSWPLLLRSTGSRRAGSVIVAHGPSCFAACGIFPDQASNPCPLHWQADSQPLRHQGSPGF